MLNQIIVKRREVRVAVPERPGTHGTVDCYLVDDIGL